MHYHSVRTHVRKGGIDCIIVLGAGLKNNGLPDKESELRLSKARELYKNKFARKLLICGGFVKDKLNISLSSAMRDLAVKLGISRKDVLLEEKSLDTLGNALFSKEIVNKNKFKNLLIMTSDYHLERALFVFHEVYGDKFMIVGTDVPTNFLKKFVFQHERIEQKYLLATQMFLTGVKKGDDKMILKRLQKLHPMYKENSREKASEHHIMRLIMK